MGLNIPIDKNKPTILITGANGLLGQKLVFQLIQEKKCNIIATGRGKCRLPASWKGYRYEQMDITKPQRIMEIFQRHRPGVVIHGASMTNVDQCEEDHKACYEHNVLAVEKIIHGCESINAHLIHISTDFVFDGKSGPYKEESATNPVNYYGKSKLESEKLVQASGLDWSIVRTGLVYGISHDMSRSNIILWIRDGLEDGKNLKLVDDQFRTPTLAEDLAMGCILVAEKRAKGIYNISGKDLLTPFDMAVKTADFFNLDKNKIKKVDSSEFKQVARRPLITGFVIDKAMDELGYRPKSFEEGIAILAKQFNLANLKQQ